MKRGGSPLGAHVTVQQTVAEAKAVLAQLSKGEAVARVEQSHRGRTGRWLHELGTALLEAGETDLAEEYYRAVLEHPVAQPWPALGLAKVAEKRMDNEQLAIALRACLKRFPNHAQPYWFTSLARAESMRGHTDAAERVLAEGAARFRQSPVCGVALAELFASSDRKDEAVRVWQTVLREFPADAKPGWYIGLATQLKAAGRRDEVAAIVESLAQLFPDDAASMMYRARHALSHCDWTAAHRLSAGCLERHPDSAMPEWFNVCARAQFRRGHVKEALELWSKARTRFPDAASLVQEEATARQGLGHWAEAEQLWTDLIARNPDNANLQWHVQRLRCLSKQPLHRTLGTAVAEFEARFPGHPDGQIVILEDCGTRQLGFEAVTSVLCNALEKFPGDRRLLAIQSRIMPTSASSGDGDYSAAERDAAEGDHLALLSQWSAELDRAGETAIRKHVHDTITGRSWELGPGEAVCRFLVELKSGWSLKQARLLCEDLCTRYPGHIGMACLLAQILVELREDEQAMEIIEAVPDLCRTGECLELRAWVAVRRGHLDRAQEIWRDILSSFYFPAVHAPEPNLVPAATDARDTSPHEITAFACVRDEMANLPGFLEHHRHLGIDRFVIVDNLSTDGTNDYLRAQPDVLLYQTADSFPAAGAGMRWINWLIERHGGGRWCLFVDADENFIFPGCETTPIGDFAAWLDSQGMEGVSAFMLDVYPERLLDNGGNSASRSDCCHFDSRYDWFGLVRPPYRRPAGGIRYRLFGTQGLLHKVPFIRGGRGIYLGNHETTPMQLSNVTGALLHYKCSDLFRKAGQYTQSDPDIRAPDRVPRSMRRYRRYASKLGSLANTNLCDDALTRPLGTSSELAECGLMQAPHGYYDWLKTRSGG